MNLFPFVKRQYLIDIYKDEIKRRVELSILKSNQDFTFKKTEKGGILKETTTELDFAIVLGKKRLLSYGRTSFLPYLIGNFKSAGNTKARLSIVIQMPVRSAFFLAFVYILNVCVICISWARENVQGVIVPTIIVFVSYAIVTVVFNKEKRAFLI